MSFIDLRSDTVTQPTEKMRTAMSEAAVGDDVYEEDPTILELEEKSARIFNKEKGLFFPTGTMANQAAILAHTNPGEEIIIEKDMHIYLYEVGGLAFLSGVQSRQLPGNLGQLDPQEVEAAIRPSNIHFPRTSLICLENTHNVHGGTVISKRDIDKIAEVAHQYKLPLHLDGARIFNAATYLQTTVAELTSSCDTLMFCLSKGLSAPAGSMLVGDENFINRARKCRKLLGGGMRQAGILAAAGIVALEEMTNRLQEDHENALLLAKNLAEIPWIEIDVDRVETNIIRFNLDTSHFSAVEFENKLREANIKVNVSGDGGVRMVTHKDVTRDQVEHVVSVLKSL
ncbi:low-specificity L-threonine aldolase [Natranaerobius thermophilus]|uniref:L-threonine aldolase n=1 Tax=Natranaerobius thermophilus (strain ATCC BAA-1301 / DSM 18059 / JW/NM-WN-LF) TaxID=457570 RepID=B2A6C9_NATTJ|nr:low-specificity L-threonine aldolase [Natranaerobius thermophilus]ACB84140.1 L-threonine aldolase [Natranaerobius thermophilus JW/NM-WN-LF]